MTATPEALLVFLSIMPLCIFNVTPNQVEVRLEQKYSFLVRMLSKSEQKVVN